MSAYDCTGMHLTASDPEQDEVAAWDDGNPQTHPHTHTHTHTHLGGPKFELFFPIAES